MRKKGLFIILILVFSLISVGYSFSVNYCNVDADCGTGFNYYDCEEYNGNMVCVHVNPVLGSCQDSGGGAIYSCSNDKTRCFGSAFFPPRYKICDEGKYCNEVNGLGSCVTKKSAGSSCSQDAECISGGCGSTGCLLEDGGSCSSPNLCASNDCYQGKCRSNNNWIGDCSTGSICSGTYNGCFAGGPNKYCASGYTCKTQNGKASCVAAGIDWGKVGDFVNSGGNADTEGSPAESVGGSGEACDDITKVCYQGYECYNGKCAYVNPPIPQYGWIGYGGCGDDYKKCLADGSGCVSETGLSIKKCLFNYYCYDNPGIGVSCDPAGSKKVNGESCQTGSECFSGNCANFVCTDQPQGVSGPTTDQPTEDTIYLDANNWVGLCRISNYAPDNAKGWRCNTGLDKCISNTNEVRKCAGTHYCKNGANDFFDRCEEKFDSGKTCNEDYQCKSGKCESGKCASTEQVVVVSLPTLVSDGELCVKDSNCVSGDCDKPDTSDTMDIFGDTMDIFGICRSKSYWTGGCPSGLYGVCGCASDGACKGPGGWLGVCSSKTEKIYTCGAGYHCDSELKACVENVDLKDDGESCTSNSKCNSGDCYNAGSALGKICRGDDFWIGDCPSSTLSCLDDTLAGTSSCIAGFGRTGAIITKTCASDFYCKGVSNSLFTCSAKKPSGTDCRFDNECLSATCFNNKCSIIQVNTDCGAGYTCSEDGAICVPENQNNPLINCDTNNYCTSIGGSDESSGSISASDLGVVTPSPISSVASFATCNNIKKLDGASCSNNYECVSNSCSAGFCGEQVTQPTCGDNNCDTGENSVTCAEDCAPSQLCGNNVCDTGETITGCSNDCPPLPNALCGNDLCEPTESNTNCPSDCQTCSLDLNCDTGESCSNGFCQQTTCNSADDCSSGNYCGNNGYCNPVPKSCNSLGGVSCPSGTCVGDMLADSIELNCCKNSCQSQPLYISQLNSAVTFVRSCIQGGKTQVQIMKDGVPVQDEGTLSALGVSSNTYVDPDDYSCNDGLIGDGEAQPVYGYGLLSLFLTLILIGLFYNFRKRL